MDHEAWLDAQSTFTNREVNAVLDRAEKAEAERDTLRRDVERLKAVRDLEAKIKKEALYQAELEAARANKAEKEVERLTRERDAAYAAAVRDDEVHAEAMRAVRARAEKAEAERDALWDERAWLYNITTAAVPEEHREHVDGILRAERDRLDKLRADLSAARAQVERLRGILVDAVAFGGNAHTRHHPACMCSYTQEASKNLDNCNCWVRAARAALADAAGESK